MQSSIHFGARCIVDSPVLSAEQKRRLGQEIYERAKSIQRPVIYGNLELSQDSLFLEDWDEPKSGAVTLLDRGQSIFISALNEMKRQKVWLSSKLGINRADLNQALERAAQSVRNDHGRRDYQIAGLGKLNRPVAEAIQAQANSSLDPNYKGATISLQHSNGNVYILNEDEGMLIGALEDSTDYIQQAQERYDIPIPSLLTALNRLFDRIAGIKNGSFSFFGAEEES